ncbi:glycoside hydrolase family 38 C-terminal domain-containing protein [Cohnella sp. GCM10027633]|uniref:glycoside hydrolase family 38 N-terminal domain-containing protein n=1 Tax=unclassified Cohnella TaxID=2636738 RepID=UPI0036301722
MTRRKAFVTPTTHWDREWVMTRGQFQVRWVNLVDRLLSIIAEHPNYRFLLDGQAIVLEDYLSIRPEKRELVSSLLSEDRLIAGPWYVLADQFLENGESMIRNLLIGMQETRGKGGRPMMLGYVPDSFGSLASLPLILNGFGIRLATFGRGRPTRDEDRSWYEFEWEGPAGSSVLAANRGYSEGVFLSYPDIWTDITRPESLRPEPAAVLEAFLKEAAEQSAKAAASPLYFPVGIDHMEPRASLPGIVDYINANQDEYEIVFGTPEDYLNAVAAEAGTLQQYRGEMRGSEQAPMDLVGTLSSHMPLKQANDRCETMLQRSLEPLWTMARMAGGAAYPAGLLRHLWKLLLANHPHDSICGCSLDQVHRDMMNRYEEIEGTGAYLIKDGLHALLPAIDTSHADERAVALVVVNPLGRTKTAPVRQLARVTRRFKHEAYELIDEKGAVVPSRVRRVACKNKDLESVYMTADMLARVSSKDADDDKADDLVLTVLEVDFLAEAVPGIGYRTYWIRQASLASREAVVTATATAMAKVKATDNGMENAGLAVRFHADGTFDLTYKRTSRVYSGLHYFLDREEVGDLYDHHEYPERDERDSRAVGAAWRLHEAFADRVVFRAELAWSLPEAAGPSARSATQRRMPIVAYATLRAGIDRLELAVELDNNCDDHMLRVAFETGIRTETASAYDHYHVVERTAGKPGPEWRDEPFQEFVDVSDGRDGLCLSTRGLPAYEAEQGDDGVRLLLTLLRSAGHIGPAAGANYPAPGGQCRGEHRFEYALIPHEGDWRQGDCLAQASDYRTPLLAEGDSLHGGELPSCASLLRVADADGAEPFASCLKQAEDGDGLVLRLWNDRESRVISASSPLGVVKARSVMLDESDADAEGANADGAGGFDCPAESILTLRFGDGAGAIE